MISEKANLIGISPTLKITAKARAMKAEGIDVIDLSVGEPDFPTPEHIKAAAIKAIKQDFTKYTENEGIPALKKAIVDRLKEDYGVDYEPNEVIVSAGAKSSLFHLFQALINEEEEVIIPSPYWVTYPQSVLLAKGKPVIVPAHEENGFLITPDQLRSAISPATKAVVFCNPSNPTGATYSREQEQALAEVIREEDVYVVADEIYSRLVYDDFKFSSFASLGKETKKKTIIINGVSKSYSMTGWRIGFAAGPADIISGMAKIQSHTTSNACSISQMASLEAEIGPQYEVSRMAAEFQRRRNYALSRLQMIPGISCFKPQGAFYLFPNVKSFYEKEAGGVQIRNSYGLAYYLLKEAKVAIVPGDSFGSDDHIRLSYATSMESLEEGLDRISEALAKLKTAKKVKRVALDNTITRVKKSVPVDSSISVKTRDALVGEMESHLGFETRFDWNVNINGVIIQLRTNLPHLNDFWLDNWFPAQLEADLEPHGTIYAVDGIPGREPRIFYNTETKTGVLVNTDNYGPLRSLALGLAIDVSERASSMHAVRGMTVDYEGNGLTLIGPPGTNKTELFFELLQDKRFRFHSSEIAFVRYSGRSAQADSVERKMFLPTTTVELLPRLAPLFDYSKAENVITRIEDCQDEKCLGREECRLDRGSPYCYKASKEAHVLLDPNWIGGPAGFSKRTNLRWVFILRNDQVSPPVVKLAKDEAMRILKSGEASGARGSLGPGKSQPFYNPHLLITTPDKLEIQRVNFERLLDTVSCYLFNSGVAKADKIKETVTGEAD